MIKNIFLPQAVGTYYLGPTRRVGIEIKAHEICATVIRAQGSQRTVEQAITEPIVLLTPDTSQDEAIIAALKIVHEKLQRYDELVCALPSSLVIFKELHLPFQGAHKIKQVVPFEIEAQLPFPIDTAIIDSIITRENELDASTHVLVVAAQRETIKRYQHYFEAAELKLTGISVDMIELFTLYQDYGAPIEKPVIALIHLGTEETHLAISVDKRLAHIRTLRGATQEGLDKLIADIQFTINAYKPAGKADTQFVQCVLMGEAADLPEINTSIEEHIQLPCTIFAPEEILQQKEMVNNVKTPISQSFMVALAAALKPSGEFNLHEEYEQKTEDQLLSYQLITLGALALLILGCFSLYSFLRVRTLRQAFQQAQSEAIADLQKNFKLKPASVINLAAANKAASTELKRQESAWNNLSQENRYAFLNYLSQLSACLNAKDVQLDVTHLVIKDDTIKLYGSVPGYPQLTKLQKQLECPLFKKLPKLQDWNFKTEPITLVIQK